MTQDTRRVWFDLPDGAFVLREIEGRNPSSMKGFIGAVGGFSGPLNER